MNAKAERLYCSEVSRQAGEALFGTATRTESYLLLEYDQTWGAKAFEESHLPEAVKEALKAYTKNRPALKLLVIRRQRTSRETGLHFFVARVTEDKPALYSFQLTSYEDLLSLDITAILEGQPAYSSNRQNHPLILVCTNGHRDLCCARFGTQTYSALSQAAMTHQSFEVWQSSHQGGHRFAPNVICLPQGLHYGRVDIESSQAVLEACLNEQVYLPNLRGRTCYDPVVQAADYHLRKQTGETSLGAYRLLQAEETTPKNWGVKFISNRTATVYQVDIVVNQPGTQVYDSCAFDKTASVTEHILRKIEVVEA